MVVRSRLAVAVFLVAAASSSTARAQDGDLARARALFDEAGALERRGQWTLAADKLRAALRIRETPHLRYALGWALENDDKLLEARSEYETAERTARGTADDVETLARTRRAELDAKMPVVRVVVPSSWRTGTRVTVDGREASIQSGSATINANPGARVVRVEHTGTAPIERIVYVSRGETKVVEAPGTLGTRIDELPRSAERDDGATDRKRGGEPVLPWILVGGGAALVATSAALFISSLGDSSDRDAAMGAWCTETACTNGNTATTPETTAATMKRQEAEDAASRGNMKQTAAAIVGGGGIVAAAIGGVMLLRAGEPDKPSVGSPSRVRIGAGPTLGGFGASASFRF